PVARSKARSLPLLLQGGENSWSSVFPLLAKGGVAAKGGRGGEGLPDLQFPTHQSCDFIDVLIAASRQIQYHNLVVAQRQLLCMGHRMRALERRNDSFHPA